MAVVADTCIWSVAIVSATVLRYDFDLGRVDTDRLIITALAAAVVHLVFGFVLGPYLVRHQSGSFEEVYALTKLIVLVAAVLFVANFFAQPIFVPRTVPVTAAAIALVGMFGARFVIRSLDSADHAPDSRRVVIFGAGEGGHQLVRSMLRDPDQGLLPVALLDDDPRKKRLRIDGVKVRGRREDLVGVAFREGATTLAVAVPSAAPDLLVDLRHRAEEAGLDILVLPPMSEIVGRPSTRNLRSIDLRDLLGRHPVDLDTAAVARTVMGRRVLVTGAGGSIGSELCRQIERYAPSTLVLLDRDETALQATQMSMTGRGLFEGDHVVLADIRDRARLREVFAAHRPEIVFHAAALKHLSILERSPDEAWKTNVLGTLNVLETAREHDVDTFVNISTDKAADPSSVLGRSKRLTERLTSTYGRRGRGTFVSVRFGNVLGSRGSVVGVFASQIERGGPVTVTHPDVERYFMLVDEACQLVLQAAALGGRGDVLVLDMGTPAKIDEMARTLISLSERTGVDIVYTGLRDGEKLQEQLFGQDEAILDSGHPRVSRVLAPAMARDHLVRLRQATPEQARTWMEEPPGVVLDQTVGWTRGQGR
ncbi:dTDP-glucose 4,6-dehydratase [Janibacter melonis]|uniref:dTDP-glucose 4,6-dehydratase n=1 Tax=Janibacter melonis TaxID=262209 RepID=A0A176Q984_9MICO|nr:nucleoside-diphosphate sugar epimerase/dehydratase [Janibacter melonis]OAB86240.1 dTDP-glucose 4,6-dehydratase [Janibacter melonis]